MRNKIVTAILFATFILTTPCPAVQAEQISVQAETINVPSEETLTKEQADRIVNYIIEQIASGALDSEEAVKAAIAEGEEKFQITLSEGEKKSIIKVVNTINSWEPDTEGLAEKAKELYEEYGAALLENPEQAIAEAAKDAAKEGAVGFFEGVGNFFVSMGAGVKNFFQDATKSFFGLF